MKDRTIHAYNIIAAYIVDGCVQYFHVRTIATHTCVYVYHHHHHHHRYYYYYMHSIPTAIHMYGYTETKTMCDGSCARSQRRFE